MAEARRRRILAASVLVLLLGLVLLIWFGRSSRRKSARHAVEPEAADAPVAAGARPTAGAQPTRKSSAVPRIPSGDPLIPIIDEVIVEKPEVCRGEENLITVRAHTEGGVEDAFLRSLIVSETGTSVPIRLNTRDDEQTGTQREVIVFGRGGAQAKTMLPPYRVKDCDVEHQLFLSYRLLPNSEHEIEWMARIREVKAGAPMQPVRYHWDFGDGETADTDGPFVTHDFGRRAQDTLYTQLLVTCEAVARDDSRLVGRRSLELMNHAFEELSQKGLVKMSTAMSPRFPELGADGTVEQEVRLWHFRPDAVTITKVRKLSHPVLEPGEMTRPPIESDVPARSVLGSELVPPEGLRFKVKLSDPRVSSIDYEIEGRSAEGLPAHANFSLMRPPPAPTAENSQPVMSEYVKAKIKRAMQLTGKAFVSDEEMWQLEREGKMADLRPEDFPAPPPEPEPDLPGRRRSTPR